MSQKICFDELKKNRIELLLFQNLSKVVSQERITKDYFRQLSKKA